MLHSEASDLGLHCLPVSCLWDAIVINRLNKANWLPGDVLNPCHAEYIKMPLPLLTISQSVYLIQVVVINSHTK